MDQKIEIKVGIFIAVTTLLIIIAVGYVAYKKDIFAKEYTYTLRSNTGENITQGMPVLFLGFEIGLQAFSGHKLQTGAFFLVTQRGCQTPLVSEYLPAGRLPA